ncbi:hypothetical protein RhiirB3_432969 [Rhizophagus irregularis]|nr:hypothetical protein RhiirB3_432969 [Rhizophagus irregularis]
MISFGYNVFNDILYKPFLSLKNSHCSNTLNTIIFYYIDFKNIISILQEVFDQLNVLESIHILYCDSLNSDFIQQITKINNPFKLRSLFMKEILHVESLQFLLQKIGDFLENFGFKNRNIEDEYNELKLQLYKLIMKYCTKIRYFDSGIPDNNIYLFIENNQHNINYLTINVDIYHYVFAYNELSSTVLQNLGYVLPSKLEYLCLTLCYRASDLKIFLKDSQHTFIKKLLIQNLMWEYWDEGDKMLLYIKKFIMKNERVKYLSFSELSGLGQISTIYNLAYKEEVVNEFKLHNIIVQDHNDLCITACNFINLPIYDI